MTSQKLGDFLKFHWPVVVILAAVAASAAGAFASNRSAADETETAPASGAPPSRAPSPTNAAGGESASAGWGPAYSGGEIGLSGGRKLRLPPDVYIAGVIDNVYCGPSSCPPTPLHTLKRGDSVVMIDADGNIDEAAGNSWGAMRNPDRKIPLQTRNHGATIRLNPGVGKNPSCRSYPSSTTRAAWARPR